MDPETAGIVDNLEPVLATETNDCISSSDFESESDSESEDSSYFLHPHSSWDNEDDEESEEQSTDDPDLPGVCVNREREEVDESPNKKQKGGAKNLVGYQQKTQCVDKDAVTDFLKTTRCRCEKGCLQQLFQMGTTGADVVLQLRQQRFVGKCQRVTP